jgi:hypothetical protein
MPALPILSDLQGEKIPLVEEFLPRGKFLGPKVFALQLPLATLPVNPAALRCKKLLNHGRRKPVGSLDDEAPVPVDVQGDRFLSLLAPNDFAVQGAVHGGVSKT